MRNAMSDRQLSMFEEQPLPPVRPARTDLQTLAIVIGENIWAPTLMRRLKRDLKTREQAEEMLQGAERDGLVSKPDAQGYRLITERGAKLRVQLLDTVDI